MLCSLQPDCSNPCHQAPDLETRERWPISKDIFLFSFPTATFYVFQIQCFCFYRLFMFFHRNKQNAFEKSKSNRIESNEKKEDFWILQLHCKIRAVNTFMARRISFMPRKKISPSKWVIIEIKNISLKLYSSPQQQQALFLRIHFLLILGSSHKFSYFSRKTKTWFR